MFLRFKLILTFCVLCLLVSCEKENKYDTGLIDFQDVIFPEGQAYDNNAGLAGTFINQNVTLQNVYTEEDEHPLWYGFAYSKMHDVENAEIENQYSAYVLDDGASNIFVVGYISEYNSPSIEINFTSSVDDLSLDIANSTYAALAMKNGNAWANKFTSDDYFELKITATQISGNKEEINIKLGEGTKITNVWNTIHFSNNEIVRLQFSLTSTDVSGTYMNTPSYFCLDNIRYKIPLQ